LRIHLLVNVYRADALQAALEAAEWLRVRQVDVFVDPDTAKHLPVLESVELSEFGDCDLIVAFGGDGTLIRAAHLTEDRGTPILGVYYGRFGFVTQCTGPGLIECLDHYLAGTVRVEKRMMLQADLLRAGATVATIHALNEAVLQRAVTARMMTFQVAVDGHVLTSYPSDGVVVSTPTGSTAYNLSVGGPILDPGVEALILAALAPHTLSARPLVLRGDSAIELVIKSRGDAVLSVDGQTRLHILSGDVVRVSKSPRVTHLVSVQQDDFLVKLGQRLFWSQSLIGGSFE
jgi:NAD+ kinase